MDSEKERKGESKVVISQWMWFINTGSDINTESVHRFTIFHALNLAVFLGALAGLSPYEEVDPPGATEGVISNVQVGAEHVINAILDPPGAPEISKFRWLFLYKLYHSVKSCSWMSNNILVLVKIKKMSITLMPWPSEQRQKQGRPRKWRSTLCRVQLAPPCASCRNSGQYQEPQHTANGQQWWSTKESLWNENDLSEIKRSFINLIQ